jgi:membrane-bound lytic murein transglycosylase A
MNTNSPAAARASSNSHSMSSSLGSVEKVAPLWDPTTTRPAGSTLRRVLPVLVALLVASCAQTPPPAPSVPGVPPEPAPAPHVPSPPPPGTLTKAHARWVPASFSELPGWNNDTLLDWWPALRQGCQNPPPAWVWTCRQMPTQPATELIARQWVESHMQVYQVESLEGDTAGLVTGYFEPQVDASRRPTATQKVPLYGPPADLKSRKPYWTRKQLDTLPAAQSAVRGREIAWVEDPLDALILQIQGSGRLNITEPDGTQHLVRLAFAGHNDQPYRSVGRWLIDQGELRPSEASWPGIKDWVRRNPARLQELIWQNPRMVFFREESLPDPTLGPKGAQAVPLTPGRSIAVDPGSVPYGTPVWLDTTEPLSDKPLERLVMAQDTGSAIVGAVRADYFWGWGPEAEANAGRMKQSLRMWVLWPRLR